MKSKVFSKQSRIGMLLFGVIALVAFSVIIMLLWNWLMPEIFGLKTISIWQAGGLFVLSRILFTSFWGGGKPSNGDGLDFRGENPIHEKWAKMTDDERKKFIEQRRKFFGNSPFDHSDFFGKETEETKSDENNGAQTKQ